MTFRKFVHYALTAGLTYTEALKMPPGLICDLYVMRLNYDDEEHGIRRQKNQIYD